MSLSPFVATPDLAEYSARFKDHARHMSVTGG